MINNDIDLHYLQSEAWQTFQESLGKKVFHRSGEGWEYRAILEPARFGMSRLYCPYGPAVSSKRALTNALASLDALARSQNVAYLRIQPLGYALSPINVRRFGLRQVDYSQPTHTWHIDVARPLDDIVADMKQNNRNLYRTYEKKGLKYKKSTNPADISRLTNLLRGVAAHNQISVHTDEYFVAQAEALLPIGAASLHFMTLKKETIAAALVYEDSRVSYYGHAAATHEHRKLGASTALLACIIADAHTQDKKICDLYGVTPSDDPSHRWAGFTKFKKSFGGSLHTLSPTYEVSVAPLRYTLYRVAKQLRRTLS